MGPIVLRLYNKRCPTTLIETRELSDGELSIGRDPHVGWTLDDPSRVISRLHCVVTLRDGVLTLADHSANGIYLDEAGVRPARGACMPLKNGQFFRFGDFIIAVDGGPTRDDPAFAGPDQVGMLRRIGRQMRAVLTGREEDKSQPARRAG